MKALVINCSPVRNGAILMIEYKENVEPRKQEIIDFCGGI